jgi:hypothetical protein
MLARFSLAGGVANCYDSGLIFRISRLVQPHVVKSGLRQRVRGDVHALWI